MNHLVARSGGTFEVHGGRSLHHLVFQRGYHAQHLAAGIAGQLRIHLVGAAFALFGFQVVGDVRDALLHRFGNDAVLFVVRHLDGATPARLGNGQVHGIGDLVGVHDHPALGVARRTANGLDE